jgi:hypothetical protein
MREWLLMLIPFSLILYFVVFPDQFNATLDLLHGFIFK